MGARNVLAADQASELRKLFGPSQFVKYGAQSDEQVDTGSGGERRRLRAQAGHPAEEVGIAAQLIQGVDLWMSGAEIAEELRTVPR